ncbi:MAG: CHAT domain-containing tetratricopeptide repeat protein [Saprospiraceae bacterium]
MKTIASILLYLYFSLSPFIILSQNPDHDSAEKEVGLLMARADSLQAKKDYKGLLEATALAQKTASEKLGKAHPTYFKCLLRAGQAYLNVGDFQEAKPLYEEAAVLLKNAAPPKEPGDIVHVCSRLGRVYDMIGDGDRAELYHLAAMDSCVFYLGKENHTYVECLMSLGIFYSGQGKTMKSVEFYREAIGKQEAIDRQDNIIGNLYTNLGNLQKRIGNFPEAERCYEKAKVFFESKGLDEPAYYATVLNNLGDLYRRTGRYEQAETTLLESKTLRQNIFGKKSSAYGFSLGNLGTLYQDMGQLDLAEKYLLECKDVREETLGRENADFAWTINNIAILYYQIGDLELAEKYHLEAKNIREQIVGKNHEDYLNSLYNLAATLAEENKLEEARGLFSEAETLLDATLGKDHPDYAIHVGNLGDFYELTGQLDKARQCRLKSLDIAGKNQGTQSINYILGSLKLAHLYQLKKEYNLAGPLLYEARHSMEENIGKLNKYYISILNQMAEYYAATGESQKMIATASEAAIISHQLFLNSSAHMTENELQKMVETNKNLPFIESYLSAIGNMEDPALAEIPFNDALFYKGFLQQSTRRLVQSMANVDDSTRQIFYAWKACKRQLADQYARPTQNRGNTDSLELQANDLEKELVLKVASFGQARKQVDWQAVQAALQPGEAAIEFVRFPLPSQPDSIRYAAMLVRPGYLAPYWINLFEEKQLEALFSQSSADKAAFIEKSYSNPNLYPLVWQPLEPYLEGVTRLFYAPSGLLHRLAFDALQGQDGATLSDRFTLRQLGSTRQLAIRKGSRPTPDFKAVVYGGIHYDMDSSALSKANELWVFDENQPQDRFDGALQKNLRGGSGGEWKDLRWTALEAKNVAGILEKAGAQVQVVTGYQATEESFVSLCNQERSPWVLHLSTHGFFFPDVKEERRLSGETLGEPAFKISEQPMIRSGLIFAGANQVWSGGKPLTGMEDGILTAYEISQMNLSNTELVVLSACETGLGDIQGSEGVYGLQRAFKIAGAKYLLMSLWQVPDLQTKELMTAFYVNWLEKKMEIPDAFHAAQSEMKGRYTSPFYWAGFLLVE